MKINKVLLSISALALVVFIGFGALTPAFAYQGDPSKTGPNYTIERHEAIEKAFENNDYDAWKNFMEGKGRVNQIITQENFAKFAEAHKLAIQGRYAEANVIRQELGLGMSLGQKVNIRVGQGMGYGRMAR